MASVAHAAVFGTTRKAALQIFKAACNSVNPETLVNNAIRVENDRFTVNNLVYSRNRDIYVAAFGKAVYGMCAAIESKLGPNIVKGYAIVPKTLSASNTENYNPKRIQILRGAFNNQPDDESVEAATIIYNMVSGLTYNDLLIVLVSGGGSALLSLPVDGISLEDKIKTIRVLTRSGCDIHDLNIVRSNLSKVKGGKLAQLAYPCECLTLIISDVIGNDLATIASGPTSSNSPTHSDGQKVIEKFNARDTIPESVRLHIYNNNTGDTNNKGFEHVKNVIIGSNETALNAAAESSEKLGYQSIIVTRTLEGDTHAVAERLINIINMVYELIANPFYSSTINSIKAILSSFTTRENVEIITKRVVDFSQKHSSFILLFGGETTANIKGDGVGGRNQELALITSKLMFTTYRHRLPVYALVTAVGTDGQDGPTPAAGAFADSVMYGEAMRAGYKVDEYIRNNDSYGFYSSFRGGRELVSTGLTGTNVMDFTMLIFHFTD